MTDSIKDHNSTLHKSYCAVQCVQTILQNKALVNLYICVKPENFGVKVKLGIERTFDVFSAAEAMPFALESNISHRQALGARGGKHHLGLIGRHDFVVESLKQNDRAR